MGSDPYAWLEPGTPEPAPMPLFPEVSTTRALLRGTRKRCPRCEERDTFVSWFQTRTACPRCGLRVANEEGGFLGRDDAELPRGDRALARRPGRRGRVSAVPDVAVVPLLIASAIVLISVPLWFYPRSKMIWAAVEFLVLRGTPECGEAPVARDARQRELE